MKPTIIEKSIIVPQKGYMVHEEVAVPLNSECPTLAQMTADGTADADTVMEGVVAYSQGERIVGQQSLAKMTQDSDATEYDIMAGKTAYVKGEKVAGIRGAYSEDDDVVFFDYDGTVVYSCSVEDVQNLTEMPAPPPHEGLIFQGYNWTLEELKEENAPMDVGAHYITDDGKTRLYITLEYRRTVPLLYGQSISHGVVVDWGDGSEPQSLEGTGSKRLDHTYEKDGDYIITLEPVGDCKLYISHNNGSTSILNPDIANTANSWANNILTKIEMGRNVYVYSGGFASAVCKAMSVSKDIVHLSGNSYWPAGFSFLTIPNVEKPVGAYTFYSGPLRRISLPYKNSTLGGNCLYYAQYVTVLKIPKNSGFSKSVQLFNGSTVNKLAIPKSYTYLTNRFASGSARLKKVDLPDTLTKISAQSFQNCKALRVCIVRAVTPPTLENINAFENIPDDCQIFVPAESVQAYKEASNWVTLADRIFPIEE